MPTISLTIPELNLVIDHGDAVLMKQLGEQTKKHFDKAKKLGHEMGLTFRNGTDPKFDPLWVSSCKTCGYKILIDLKKSKKTMKLVFSGTALKYECYQGSSRDRTQEHAQSSKR